MSGLQSKRTGINEEYSLPMHVSKYLNNRLPIYFHLNHEYSMHLNIGWLVIAQILPSCLEQFLTSVSNRLIASCDH